MSGTNSTVAAFDDNGPEGPGRRIAAGLPTTLNASTDEQLREIFGHHDGLSLPGQPMHLLVFLDEHVAVELILSIVM